MKEELALCFLEDASLECGCDEAGRGPLVGDVFAAAVILPKDCRIKGLNDSKKLSEKKRYLLRPIIEQEALSFAIGRVSAEEIDAINILQASFLAMHRAIDGLEQAPERILVDGNRFTAYGKVEHHCIVKGDALYQSIAAASILAKTYRDDYMLEMAKMYPEYAWEKNKGYPTKEHYLAIEKYGISPIHRKSFRLTEKVKK